MEDFMCNVLIMGKTGTGKSTLLNYICDANIAQTGTGKPVTGEGIYESVVKINNQDVRLFDSWGIEAGKVDRWKNLLKQELENHGTQKDIKDWFHSIIYCIQAGGGRVESIDTEIIRQFMNEGYKLTIVLTKADQIGESDEAIMKETIVSEVGNSERVLTKGLNVISTCAEHKVTRAGEIHPFGKEAVCQAILDGWRDTVLERLPKHVIARVCDYVEAAFTHIKDSAMASDISGIEEANMYAYDEINQKIEDLQIEVNEKVLPNIMNDISECCHKTDMYLSAMFRVDNVPAKPGRKSDIPRPTIKVPLPWLVEIIGLIIKVIRSRSAERIEEQRVAINDYIDMRKQRLIAQYKRQESEIARQIKQSI